MKYQRDLREITWEKNPNIAYSNATLFLYPRDIHRYRLKLCSESHFVIPRLVPCPCVMRLNIYGLRWHYIDLLYVYHF